MIYAIKADRYTKIGVSKNIENRLSNMQSGCPFKIEVLFTMDGDYEEEGKIHTQLDFYNTYGEWFDLPFEVDKELLEFLIEEYDYQKEQGFKKVKVNAVRRHPKGATEYRLRGSMKANSKKKKESIDRISSAIEFQKQLGVFITKASISERIKDIYGDCSSHTTVKKHWKLFKDDIDDYNNSMFGADSFEEHRKTSIIEQLIDSYNRGNKTKIALHRDTGVSRPTIDNYWKIITK